MRLGIAPRINDAAVLLFPQVRNLWTETRIGGTPGRVKFYEHPLNQEINRFDNWLWEKLDAGQITRSEMGDILRAGNNVFDASGLPPGPDFDSVSLGVFRQLLHASRQRLLQIHPELEDELRNLTSGHTR